MSLKFYNTKLGSFLLIKKNKIGRLLKSKILTARRKVYFSIAKRKIKILKRAPFKPFTKSQIKKLVVFAVKEPSLFAGLIGKDAGLLGTRLAQNAFFFAHTFVKTDKNKDISGDVCCAHFFSGLGKYNEQFARSLGKNSYAFAKGLVCPEKGVRAGLPVYTFAWGLGKNAGFFAQGLGKDVKFFAQGLGENAGWFSEGLLHYGYGPAVESFAKGLNENAVLFADGLGSKNCKLFAKGLGKTSGLFAETLKSFEVDSKTIAALTK